MSSQVKVADFMTRNLTTQKNTGRSFLKVFVYPQNDLREVARIMSDIKIDKLPVLFSPWNRKLIGFIEFKKINAFLVD